MNQTVAENIRRALADGHLTSDEVLSLLVESKATGAVRGNADELTELAAELRAAATSIGRAAAIIARIAPAQEEIGAVARVDAETLRAIYPHGLPRKNTYRAISARLGWGMNKTTNAIRAYRAQANGVFAGRERSR